MRDILIHFLDRIREYEHESGHNMYEDERESSEIVDIHLEAHPELKNNGDLAVVVERSEQLCQCKIPSPSMSDKCSRCDKIVPNE